MLLGLALFYVGAVLFLNGLWLLGRIGDREIALINVFVGCLSLLIALYSAFGPAANLVAVKGAGLTMLFSITYFWVAFNRYSGADGRGLGWFSLFVAITLVPVTLESLAGASSVLDVWLALCWGAWMVLWFMFYLLLAQQRPILKITGVVTLLCGILTGWLPGYLMMDGRLV